MMADGAGDGPVRSEIDLLARYHLVEELSRSKKRYQKLVEQLHEVVFQANDLYQFTFLNPAWTNLTGREAKQCIGRSIFEYIDDSCANTWKNFENQIGRGKQTNFISELCIRHVDGGHRWVAFHISKDNPDSDWVGSMHDISERKRTEKLLLAKELAEKSDKAKSAFLANISHELRTPMHAIISFAEIGIKKNGKVAEEDISRYFRRVLESGNRLLLLINDLLDLSKLESGSLNYNQEENDLEDITNTAIAELSELASKKSLQVIIDPPVVDTVCVFDRDKILQVIRNMLSNAIKFTPEGKTIRFRIKESSLPLGRRREDQGIQPALLLMIEDQGVGIPDDELVSIFDKFVQSSKTRAKSGGTGLGLAISKEIIEGHGGLIQADHNPHGGAIFSFVIPCLDLSDTTKVH
jgi:PAS domain S-box-containing protein